MHNITLISTRHEVLGNCNSEELYRIFERIKPEVIFEEIPPSCFQKYYIEKSRRNLETDTINNYLNIFSIEHIPVDSDDVPSEVIIQQHQNMRNRVEGLTDVNGFDFRTMTDSNKQLIEIYGFQYLNSASCMYKYEVINEAIKNGLKKLNNENLFEAYNQWNEINERRENEMLQNIYSYSLEHKYKNAIFTLGAGHRKSIIRKIEEYQDKSSLKLNWVFTLPDE